MRTLRILSLVLVLLLVLPIPTVTPDRITRFAAVCVHSDASTWASRSQLDDPANHAVLRRGVERLVSVVDADRAYRHADHDLPKDIGGHPIPAPGFAASNPLPLASVVAVRTGDETSVREPDVVVAPQGHPLLGPVNSAGEHREPNRELVGREDPQTAPAPGTNRIVVTGWDPWRLAAEDDIQVADTRNPSDPVVVAQLRACYGLHSHRRCLGEVESVRP